MNLKNSWKNCAIKMLKISEFISLSSQSVLVSCLPPSPSFLALPFPFPFLTEVILNASDALQNPRAILPKFPPGGRPEARLGWDSEHSPGVGSVRGGQRS